MTDFILSENNDTMLLMSTDECPHCGMPIERKRSYSLCLYCDKEARVTCKNCDAGICRDHTVRLAYKYSHEVGKFDLIGFRYDGIQSVRFVCKTCAKQLMKEYEGKEANKTPYEILDFEI